MAFQVITIARECGSGGGTIAELLGKRLGWSVLDRALISEVARLAQVDARTVERYDECIDSWLYRVSKRGLWHGAFEGVATPVEASCFDAETMAEIVARVMSEAADAGRCVIVGRGGQCVLQTRKDAFHVYVYAPLPERIRRLRQRLATETDLDLEEYIEATDKRRSECIRLRFHQDRANHHLYHLMIGSSIGEDRVVDAVIAAMGKAGA
jgi:cytidylate kinase